MAGRQEIHVTIVSGDDLKNEFNPSHPSSRSDQRRDQPLRRHRPLRQRGPDQIVHRFDYLVDVLKENNGYGEYKKSLKLKQLNGGRPHRKVEVKVLIRGPGYHVPPDPSHAPPYGAAPPAPYGAPPPSSGRQLPPPYGYPYPHH
ncbi:hypothetical protein Gohar_012004 [Gossypium harknessii]|uniref:Uncharacterized protein n=1 Tax=Gossypium harknessii TaxID=34285 RepID=A0A7J9GVS8_9ROSI|nr:hypothetical protein [Gossypium harknessii]